MLLHTKDILYNCVFLSLWQQFGNHVLYVRDVQLSTFSVQYLVAI